MDRTALEDYLAAGLSLEAIGSRVGRHPSTVSYWLKKFNLQPVHGDKHRARGGIDEQRLRQSVDSGLPLRAIATELEVSVGTVRYWLTKLGLRTAAATHQRPVSTDSPPSVMRECKYHGHTTFVRVGSPPRYRCRHCGSEYRARRRQARKHLLVAEAGGRCWICGFDGSLRALQFHHLDPTTKSFALSEQGPGRVTARAREEARKCVILCANCHAEVDAGVTPLPEVANAVAGTRAHDAECAVLRPAGSAQSPKEQVARPTRETRRCPYHGLTPHQRDSDGGDRYFCLRCRADAVVRRRRKVKAILVMEAGGACVICGYDRSPAALHFHHRDPTQKKFGLADGGIGHSIEAARAEAVKCELVCANCHAQLGAHALSSSGAP